MELLEKLAALVPRPGSISCATTGSWRPGPGPASASCRPSRLPSRRRRTARRALRPAAIGGAGRPCWRGCFPPTSANARLWRSPADRRRPDRSDLDPDLSGGGRAAGDAPAESPASAAVRVRRLTSSAIRSRRRAYGGVCPHQSLRPRIDPDTGRQATKLYCELGRRTGNDPQGSCRTLAVRSAP